MINQV